MDANAPRRRSHENRDVQTLYETELTGPNSEAAHDLLHTEYAGRRSARSLLMRFLDCVDRRDGEAAAQLFHPEAVWSTASPFGDIEGASNIEAFIRTRLPPRLYGPHYKRHRMAGAGEGEFTVLTPDGEACRFILDVCELDETGRSRTVISRLERELL